jgi:hypothetical protein
LSKNVFEEGKSRLLEGKSKLLEGKSGLLEGKSGLLEDLPPSPKGVFGRVGGGRLSEL